MRNATNSKQAQTLKSYFEKTLNLKENNFNFGRTEILKSRAMRLRANRYVQLLNNRALNFEII